VDARYVVYLRDADMYGVEAIVSVELAGQAVPAT